MASDEQAVRERLERASEGLLYLSEDEASFRFFHLPFPAEEPLDAERFAVRLEVPAGTRVEERSLETFLAGHIEESDPADPVAQEQVGRFRALREALRDTLGEVRVFRIGEVEIRCYLVGRGPGGDVMGLSTRALET